MDDILEIILEIVLEGAVELAGSKRIPLPIRIILAALVFLLVGGVCGLLLFIGMKEKELVLVIIGAGLLIFFTIMTARKIYLHKQKSDIRK